MKDGVLLAATIENITTRKDRTIKLVIGTQELSPAKAGELFTLLHGVAVFYISPKEISQDEIDLVDTVDPEFNNKTQSQRIRAVLYKLFEQDKEGFNNFDQYYHNKTEKFIEHLKSKIQ